MNRVGIVGLGLIGGSIARRLLHLGWEVTGVDPDPVVAADAADLGVRMVSRPGELDGNDPVILATPASTTAWLFETGQIPSGLGLVIDTASTKTAVTAAAMAGPRDVAARFVGGHPMAGKADGGFDNSDGWLLVGATWVLTPGVHTQSGTVNEAIALVDACFDAPCLVLPPGLHDRTVARTSHLPHVLGQMLVRSLGERTALAAAVAAGSFNDATRVVRGSATFPAELVWGNRDRVTDVLSAAINDLQRVRDILAVGSKDGLDDWFTQRDLDTYGPETLTIPVLQNGSELDELVSFGLDGWTVRPGEPGELVLTRQ